MQVTQNNLIIYCNGQATNMMIDLSSHLYAFLPTFVIPSGELTQTNNGTFYVCIVEGNEWVFFVREIISQNNCVSFSRKLSLV